MEKPSLSEMLDVWLNVCDVDRIVLLIGLKVGEKWTTDSNLSTEVSIEDQLVSGLKLSFEALFAPQTGYGTRLDVSCAASC